MQVFGLPSNAPIQFHDLIIQIVIQQLCKQSLNASNHCLYITKFLILIIK